MQLQKRNRLGFLKYRDREKNRQGYCNIVSYRNRLRAVHKNHYRIEIVLGTCKKIGSNRDRLRGVLEYRDHLEIA